MHARTRIFIHCISGVFRILFRGRENKRDECDSYNVYQKEGKSLSIESVFKI